MIAEFCLVLVCFYILKSKLLRSLRIYEPHYAIDTRFSNATAPMKITYLSDTPNIYLSATPPEASCMSPRQSM